MTTETSNARGGVVAWFPTYASGEIVRNYGDGSPVYACKTKEEAEQARRCHLGATGPVIPLYAAPPPAAVDEAGAFDANFLRSVANLCRAAYDLCQPKPQRTPEDVREHHGELCLSELASIADEIERRLAPPSAPVGVEGLVRLLERIRDLLASLPVDCLGSGTSVNGQPYPIRDEVIHGITKALAQQPAAVGGSDAQSAEIDALRAEVERATQWNERVSVCRDHVTDIVDGPCVICALDAAEARADKLTEALREAQPFIGWAGSYPELHAKIDALLRDQEEGNGQ